MMQPKILTKTFVLMFILFLAFSNSARAQEGGCDTYVNSLQVLGTRIQVWQKKLDYYTHSSSFSRGSTVNVDRCEWVLSHLLGSQVNLNLQYIECLNSLKYNRNVEGLPK